MHSLHGGVCCLTNGQMQTLIKSSLTHVLHQRWWPKNLIPGNLEFGWQHIEYAELASKKSDTTSMFHLEEKGREYNKLFLAGVALFFCFVLFCFCFWIRKVA